MPRIVIDNRPPQFVFDDSNKLSDGMASFLQSLVETGHQVAELRRQKEADNLARLWHDQAFERQKANDDWSHSFQREHLDLERQALLAKAAAAHGAVDPKLWKAAVDQFTVGDGIIVPKHIDGPKALAFYNQNAKAAGLPLLTAIPEEPPAPMPAAPAPPPPAPGLWDRITSLFGGGGAPAAAAPARPMIGPPAPAPAGGDPAEAGVMDFGSAFGFGSPAAAPAAPAPAPTGQIDDGRLAAALAAINAQPRTADMTGYGGTPAPHAGLDQDLADDAHLQATDPQYAALRNAGVITAPDGSTHVFNWRAAVRATRAQRIAPPAPIVPPAGAP